jgi:hypothetical protein
MLSAQLSKQIHFSISHHVAGAGNSDSQAYLNHLLQSFTPNIIFLTILTLLEILIMQQSSTSLRKMKPEMYHQSSCIGFEE